MPGGGGWAELLNRSDKGRHFRDGLAEGVLFAFTPDFGEWVKPSLWFAVGQQVFFAHIVGQSVLPSLAGYNNWQEPILTWSVIIGLINMAITISTCIMTYTLIGQQAKGVKMTIKEQTNDHYFILKSWQ